MDCKKSFSFIGILALLVLSLGVVSAASLAEWSLTSDGSPTYSDTNINAGDFTGGLGIKTLSTAEPGSIAFDIDGADSKYWTEGTSLAVDDYFQITLSPKTGYDLTISTLNFMIERSGSGPQDYKIQYSKNLGFSTPVDIATKNLPDDSETDGNITGLGINVSEEETIYIRLFGYNSDTEGTGILRILADTLNIQGTVTESTPETPDEPFCDYGNEGNLNVEIKHVDVEEGFGDDEEYWYPLDKVEIDVEIENDGDWDVEDIELEICLFDVDEGKCIMDEDDMDIEDDKFDLDEGDDITITVKLDVDPREFKEGNKDYTFKVKATGEIDDSDSPFDKDKTCSSDSQDIEIRTNEKFLILDKITATDLTSPNEPGKVSCGSEVLFTANVWNVGDDKIKDDKIFIRVYSKDLGIQETIDMEDISSLDKEELSFRITIPENLDKRFYAIKFSIYDDEDLSDNDLYENSEDDEAIFEYVIEITECGAPTTQEPTITATLLSEAKVGEELIVQVSITNNVDTVVDNFIITADGYDSWAELVSGPTPSVLDIQKGETKQVVITLKPTQAGSYIFKINVIHDGQTTGYTVKDVNISEKTGFMTGAFAGLGNAGLYIISVVVLILIIVIIALIVKVKSAVPAEF